jgi:hypothetical protein
MTSRMLFAVKSMGLRGVDPLYNAVLCAEGIRG